MSLLSSISQVVTPSEDTNIAKAALVDLKPNGSIDTSTYRTFQYFPETISDNRSSEWRGKDVIGGSHPLYQWISGSGRDISFEVVFTRDYMSTQSNGSLSSTLNLIESIAKNPLGTAIAAIKGGSSNNEGDYTVKIEGAVAWLRSKTYPSYPNNIAVAPPRMLLVLPGTGIFSGAKMNIATPPGTTPPIMIDCIPVVMTTCNVNYEAFFRTGEPRAVTVALSFAEIIQTGTPGWGFIDGEKSMNPIWQRGAYSYKNGASSQNIGRQLTTIVQGKGAGTPSPNPLSSAVNALTKSV